MLLLGLLSLAVGIGFVSIGAWPVCGFFGLDVAALYLAFRISYRRARQREVLRLAGDDFTVERVGIRGERAVWRFQPFWLRIVLEERGDTSNRLIVASHGRSLVIGDFLGAPVRRELAHSLRAALGSEPLQASYAWAPALAAEARKLVATTEGLPSPSCCSSWPSIWSSWRSRAAC